VHFENAQPILRVADMQRALDFYVGQLGFENADWGNGDFTCVTRDRAAICLCRGRQGPEPGHGGASSGCWVWIGVSDARALHDQLQSRGVRITMPPTHFLWAVEFNVQDPDGNTLRIGSDPDQA
jgi:predicted enzyme related to lactoylglutathione lyase